MITRRSALLVVVCTFAGCAQVLGIEDPGAVSGTIATRDAMPPPDQGKLDAANQGACARLPAWGAATNYGVTGGLAIAVGDVTHDGVEDAVVTTLTDVLVFPGGGPGASFGFGASHPLTPGTPIVATNALVLDVDGDGFQDVLTWKQNGPLGPGSSAIAIHIQNPAAAGTFKAPTILTVTANGGDLRDVEKANFDGDARDDILVSAGGAVRYLGAASGTFGSASALLASGAQQLTAIDVDGDALDDVVAVTNSTLLVFYNDPSTPNTFGSGLAIGGATAEGGVFGHFSAGAGRDLLLYSMIGNAALYVQDAPRTFSEHAANAVFGLRQGALSEPNIAIDLDGDGRDDVVAVNNYAVQCAAPAPFGTFFPGMSDPAMLTTPATMSGVGFVVDLNADNRPDYLTFDTNNLQRGASLLEVFLQ